MINSGQAPHNPLRDGYDRFVQRKDPSAQSVMALAEGQAPHSVIITCCDSRIDPLSVFDAPPGHIFIIRNAGALVPPAQDQASETVAALHLALTAFPIERVLVMGHSNCGAAATIAANTAPDGPLVQWLQSGQALRAQWAKSSGAECQSERERAMVAYSVHNLQSWPFVQQAMQDGNLDIRGAWFSLDDLSLHWLQSDGAFLL